METSSHAALAPVGIIGNLNIDLTIRNLTQLPEWGREVIGDNYDHTAAGQAAKTGLALARLGHPVKLIANVGDDPFGREIIDTLSAGGVDVNGVETTPNARSGLSVAVVRPDGERAFISDTACLKHFTIALVKRHLQSLNSCSVVCLLGSFFIPGLPLGDIANLLKELKAENKTIVLDTGWDSANWQSSTLHELKRVLKLTDIFIPNEEEARAITGFTEPHLAAQALSAAGAGKVIIKLGSRGSYLYTKHASLYEPARKVKALDTVGAGDVFNAGFLHAFMQSLPPQASLRFGNALASIYVSRLTNRFADAAEVHAVLKTYPALEDGIQPQG